MLSESQDLHPFEKHLSGLESPYELLRKGSWVSGNAAAENGFDLRLFYQVRRQSLSHLAMKISHKIALWKQQERK